VQNFLRSLGASGGSSSSAQQAQQSTVFTTLSDLLTPEACIATLNNASSDYLDNLLAYIPPQLLTLAQRADDLSSLDDLDSSSTQATVDTLSVEQKKDLLTRVFRSPQLYQSLGSLTMALRDGGLPMVADALKIKVENGGLIRGGHVPLGEGQAVEAFLEGVKKTVKEEDEQEGKSGGRTDTS
jgi:26S proteasome regulatory subunit N13